MSAFAFPMEGYMKTATAKKSASEVREKTPAQRYEEWYDEQIRLGIEDIEAGRVISHEEVMKHSDAHLAELKKKYG
jgi:predicted transcriptional regulator